MITVTLISNSTLATIALPAITTVGAAYNKRKTYVLNDLVFGISAGTGISVEVTNIMTDGGATVTATFGARNVATAGRGGRFEIPKSGLECGSDIGTTIVATAAAVCTGSLVLEYS